MTQSPEQAALTQAFTILQKDFLTPRKCQLANTGDNGHYLVRRLTKATNGGLPTLDPAKLADLLYVEIRAHVNEILNTNAEPMLTWVTPPPALARDKAQRGNKHVATADQVFGAPEGIGTDHIEQQKRTELLKKYAEAAQKAIDDFYPTKNNRPLLGVREAVVKVLQKFLDEQLARPGIDTGDVLNKINSYIRNEYAKLSSSGPVGSYSTHSPSERR